MAIERACLESPLKIDLSRPRQLDVAMRAVEQWEVLQEGEYPLEAESPPNRRAVDLLVFPNGNGVVREKIFVPEVISVVYRDGVKEQKHGGRIIRIPEDTTRLTQSCDLAPDSQERALFEIFIYRPGHSPERTYTVQRHVRM